jgi:CubicO group peptidase (beta-lactamase class C family)
MFEPTSTFLWGSGGVLATPGDYLRFAQMLLQYGELDGVRVLKSSSVQQMITNRLTMDVIPFKTGLNAGYGQGFGGVVLMDSTLARIPGPNGIYRWSGYVGTYFWIDPLNDLVAMVWTQFTPGRTYPIEAEFQRLVYGAVK